MSSDRADDYARHWDNLLWTVTGILVAVDGALLVYMSDQAGQNFDPWIGFSGLGLAVAAVYFAASFRELRQRVTTDPEVKAIIGEGRRFFQWPVFVLMFLWLEVNWIRLLLENRPELCIRTWCIGTASLAYTIWLYWIGRGLMTRPIALEPSKDV